MAVTVAEIVTDIPAKKAARMSSKSALRIHVQVAISIKQSPSEKEKAKC